MTRNADLALARNIDGAATLAETWDAGGLSFGAMLTLVETDGARGLHMTQKSDGTYWVGDDGVTAEDTAPVDGDELVDDVCSEWRESVTVACGGSLIEDNDEDDEDEPTRCAREEFNLTEIRTHGDHTLVSDEADRYWVRTSALAIEVPTYTTIQDPDGEKGCAEYSSWCSQNCLTNAGNEHAECECGPYAQDDEADLCDDCKAILAREQEERDAQNAEYHEHQAAERERMDAYDDRQRRRGDPDREDFRADI